MNTFRIGRESYLTLQYCYQLLPAPVSLTAMNGRFNTQKILKWLKATSCGWVEQAELKQRSSYDHMHTLRQIRVSVLMQPAFLYGLYALLQWLLCVLILAFVVIQVELERVRLICERICRRERLKVPTSWILPSWSARI